MPKKVRHSQETVETTETESTKIERSTDPAEEKRVTTPNETETETHDAKQSNADDN